MNSKHYNGRKVLITGHTGFKGSWLCRILKTLGAEIYGYSLEPPTEPNLFTIANVKDGIRSETGDIRDYDKLFDYVCDVAPQTVIHMAAQPLVSVGYERPRETYDVNVMGTVNIMECVRHAPSVESFLNVTTDKVYENSEAGTEFVETDSLNGQDPYSNSKSCSELVTQSYKKSFFHEKGSCAVSTARAGNVIGGRDFSDMRIIPDCIRAALSGKPVVIRNPGSIRPYQHVLEPLFAYLLIAEKQARSPELSGHYNVGPAKNDAVTTGELVEIFRSHWGDMKDYVKDGKSTFHEAKYLRLNTELIESKLGFKPRWTVNDAVAKTVEWTKVWQSGEDVRDCMDAQIRNYVNGE